MDLKYGENSFTFEIPAARLRAVIRPESIDSAPDPTAIISAALDNCASQLRTFRPGERVVIITSDITRHTGSDIFLPLLVERLNRAGIPDRDMEIVIALGIHRRQTEHEHRKILGTLFGRIKVSDHDCDDPGGLVCVGRTAAGIDVEISRTVAAADRIILTGSIGFHYFAGFGGGRKSVLPGVASRRACMASHFAVLNPLPGSGRNEQAVTGNLDSNPVHAAMMEACALVKPDFILNTVLSQDKRIIAAFAGDWREAHLAGCRFYAAHFTFPLREKGDLVVASCGGYPKDINFIQAHKSMEYGSQALKPGGVMILLAQCRDGYGNATFFNWFRFRDLGKFEAELRRNYEINGQTAFSTLQKSTRFRVILVSDLHPEEVAAMGMIPAKNLVDAMTLAERLLPEEYAAYVIPEGGTVLPVVTQGVV
jgi:nickel-dependent lactate racemase